MTDEQEAMVRLLHAIQENYNRTLLLISNMIGKEVKNKAVVRSIDTQMRVISDAISRDTYQKLIGKWVVDSNIDRRKLDALIMQLDIGDYAPKWLAQTNWK